MRNDTSKPFDVDEILQALVVQRQEIATEIINKKVAEEKRVSKSKASKSPSKPVGF